MYDIVEAEHPATVRQVFYAMTTKGLIDKAEREYKGTVVRLLGDMRRNGELPYRWIADNTRWQRKPVTWQNMSEMLEHYARTYRRDLWIHADEYVEVWLEKEALAGVLYDATAALDVPLMVSRGFASISFLHSAAEDIAHIDKPTTLYYIGDHDPSGLAIPKTIERTIRQLAPDVELKLVRLAVNEDQIEGMNLPTRPTKTTDTRAKGFKGESVEVDAIPPSKLRQIVTEAVESHVDTRQLELIRTAEQSERSFLHSLADRGVAGGG